jgi:hypothetical protein
LFRFCPLISGLRNKKFKACVCLITDSKTIEPKPDKRRRIMMKKTALAVLGLFVLSNFGFAGEGKFGKKHKEMTPEQKAKWETVKKEKAEYFKNLEALTDKYNKVSDAHKDSVKKDITALVATQTDKNLAAGKEKLLAQQNKIAEIENDKTAYVVSLFCYFPVSGMGLFIFIFVFVLILMSAFVFVLVFVLMFISVLIFTFVLSLSFFASLNSLLNEKEMPIYRRRPSSSTCLPFNI